MNDYNELLNRIKSNLPDLYAVREDLDREFGAPDLFYRFYHQSFKVYAIQNYTSKLLDLFVMIGGEHLTLNSWYSEIVAEGINKTFDYSHNDNWLVHARPMMEAYFHSKMFLDMMIWCAENMESDDGFLPSPWAAVLYLYNMR